MKRFVFRLVECEIKSQIYLYKDSFMELPLPRTVTERLTTEIELMLQLNSLIHKVSEKVIDSRRWWHQLWRSAYFDINFLFTCQYTTGGGHHKGQAKHILYLLLTLTWKMNIPVLSKMPVLFPTTVSNTKRTKTHLRWTYGVICSWFWLMATRLYIPSFYWGQ